MGMHRDRVHLLGITSFLGGQTILAWTSTRSATTKPIEAQLYLMNGSKYAEKIKERDTALYELLTEKEYNTSNADGNTMLVAAKIKILRQYLPRSTKSRQTKSLTSIHQPTPLKSIPTVLVSTVLPPSLLARTRSSQETCQTSF